VTIRGQIGGQDGRVLAALSEQDHSLVFKISVFSFI